MKEAKILAALPCFQGAELRPDISLPGGDYGIDDKRGSVYSVTKRTTEVLEGEAPAEQDGQQEETKAFFLKSPLAIRRIVRHIEDGDERLEIVFRRDGRWMTLLVDRADAFQGNALVKALAPFGAPVAQWNAIRTARYLSDFDDWNERRLERVPCVTRCGHFEIDGERFFALGRSAIGGTAVEFDDRAGIAPIVDAIRCAGTEELQLRTLRAACAADELAGAMVFGALAAPMLHVIGAPSFGIQLWGESSRGKSTKLLLAASIYGNPGSKALVGSWEATGVGLEQRAAALCDLPLPIDESTGTDARARQQAAYNLVNGAGKTRGARDGGLRRTQTWRTVVLSTGEGPLLDENANTGSQVRIASFRNERFGNFDAEKVQKVETSSRANYGHVGRRWIKYLLGIDRELLQAEYVSAIRAARAIAGSDPIAARRAGYFAVMAVAEKHAYRELSIGRADAETVMGLLRTGAADSVVTMADRSIAVVRDWVASEPRSFLERTTNLQGDDDLRDADKTPRVYGYRDEDSIDFIPAELERHLASRQINPTAARKAWNEQGWLIRGTDNRLTRKRRIPGIGLMTLVSIRRDCMHVDDEGYETGNTPELGTELGTGNANHSDTLDGRSQCSQRSQHLKRENQITTDRPVDGSPGEVSSHEYLITGNTGNTGNKKRIAQKTSRSDVPSVVPSQRTGGNARSAKVPATGTDGGGFL